MTDLKPSAPPSSSEETPELREAMDEYRNIVIEGESEYGSGGNYSEEYIEWSKRLKAARSAIESLFARQREEIERLKASQLTPVQAQCLIEVLEKHPEDFDLIALGTFYRLRLLSESPQQDTGE